MTLLGRVTVDVIVGRHAWQAAMVAAATPSRVLGVAVRVVDELPLHARTLWHRTRPRD